MQFKSFGFSDLGKVRNKNEDNYLCDETNGLFLVADGMGGHASGEIASKVAVESVNEFVVRSRDEEFEWPVKYRDDLSLEQNRLLSGVIFSNRKIHKIADKNPSMKGMGTTLVGGIIEGDNFVVVNVGDSRLYRIRNGSIDLITRDHTWVGDQVKKGILTKEEALNHPQKHVLTSALGHMRKKPVIDLFDSDISENDLFLLCSDGLYNMLSDTEMLEIISSIGDHSLYKIGISLALKANLAGGSDNITLVLISFSN
ncbi:Stp1/IreP family PP2C-type Ser/Thr phosphatase [Thermodesulfobacteriota bacterium]